MTCPLSDRLDIYIPDVVTGISVISQLDVLDFQLYRKPSNIIWSYLTLVNFTRHHGRPLGGGVGSHCGGHFWHVFLIMEGGRGWCLFHHVRTFLLLFFSMCRAFFVLWGRGAFLGLPPPPAIVLQAPITSHVSALYINTITPFIIDSSENRYRCYSVVG